MNRGNSERNEKYQFFNYFDATILKHIQSSCVPPSIIIDLFLFYHEI